MDVGARGDKRCDRIRIAECRRVMQGRKAKFISRIDIGAKSDKGINQFRRVSIARHCMERRTACSIIRAVAFSITKEAVGMVAEAADHIACVRFLQEPQVAPGVIPLVAVPPRNRSWQEKPERESNSGTLRASSGIEALSRS